MNPRSDKTLRRLSVAASIGFMLMVGATTTYIAWPRVAGAIGIKPAPPPPAPPAYVAGQQVDVPAEWYNTARHTLVLFARESCSACQKAQPYLQTLVESVKGRASVVMAHPAGNEESDALFARSMGIPEANRHIVKTRLRVKATPTLLLVNQQGAILAAWEGAGRTEKQAEITKTIHGLLK